MEQRFFLGESSIKELIPILQEYTPDHIFLVRGKILMRNVVHRLC